MRADTETDSGVQVAADGATRAGAEEAAGMMCSLILTTVEDHTAGSSAMRTFELRPAAASYPPVAFWARGASRSFLLWALHVRPVPLLQPLPSLKCVGVCTLSLCSTHLTLKFSTTIHRCYECVMEGEKLSQHVLQTIESFRLLCDSSSASPYPHPH